MSAEFYYAFAGAGLFSIGMYALLVNRHLLRKILAINVMGSGVFLVLAGMAVHSDIAIPDPVPHAMIITGIVVAVAATALALVLMLKLAAGTGQAVLPGRKKEEDP